MFVVVTTNHVTVFGPINEGDRRAMDADKAPSIVMNEREEIRFLLRIHREIASREKDHRIEIIEILCVVLQFFLGKSFGIGA